MVEQTTVTAPGFGPNEYLTQVQALHETIQRHYGDSDALLEITRGPQAPDWGRMQALQASVNAMFDELGDVSNWRQDKEPLADTKRRTRLRAINRVLRLKDGSGRPLEIGSFYDLNRAEMRGLCDWLAFNHEAVLVLATAAVPGKLWDKYVEQCGYLERPLPPPVGKEIDSEPVYE